MDSQIFTTEKVARILGLPEWRVVRFAQTDGYGIRPAYGDAAGPGSRRLYDLENVCEIALASWLVQAGLRVEVIGRVLKQLRKQGGLTHYLVTKLKDARLDTYLGVIRTPKGPQSSQESVLIQSWGHLANIFGQDPFSSVLVIPLGARFFWLAGRLYGQEEEKGV